MKPQEFFEMLAPAAQQSAKETKVPASFVLAQAALESAWGESDLAKQGKNLFGVKADALWKGKFLKMQTKEYFKCQWTTVNASWRKYDDWLDCLNDHAQFFLKNKRYKPCFECTTAKGFAKAVANAGYATDPDYAKKIIALMDKYGLEKYDQA